MIKLSCQICGSEFKVLPKRKNAKFCSNKCRGEGRAKSGAFKLEAHPRWKGGEREKICQGCGFKIIKPSKQAISTFEKRKFCTKICADEHGFRYSGESHPNYRPDSRRKSRAGKHGAWARAVISRDQATCRKCGAKNLELHAHHIKPYATHPELRWVLDNGLTLCYRCHWQEHTALTANAVNSGNTPPEQSEGNPEPSNERKFVEGVTTRGRAYRRWSGSCANCNAFISKRWSDTDGKKSLFCSRSCAGKWGYRNGKRFGRQRQ